ncbi:unnamed protein product, partial [Ascophyllum nodosum]
GRREEYLRQAAGPSPWTEQPRGGMSVLHECSQEAGCKLEVVDALPTHDPAGIPYDIGLAGEHQLVN